MLAESLHQFAAPIRNEFLQIYSSPTVGLPDREEGITVLQDFIMCLLVMQHNILEAINSTFRLINCVSIHFHHSYLGSAAVLPV